MSKRVHTSIAVTGQGTGSVNGTPVRCPSDSVEVQVITANVGGTGPTVDVKLQWSIDNGTTWSEPESADSFTQITADGSVVGRFSTKGVQVRPVATVGGTTPTADITVHIAAIEAL